MRFSTSRRTGSALVIILPIVAILAVIIVTVLSIALYDSHITSSSFNQAQASTYVKYAIDDVSDKLAQIPLDRHWAAGPGRIRYWDGTSTWTQIDLHSGAPATAPAAATSYLDGSTGATAASCVQLNVPLSDGSYSIMPANAAYSSAPDMTIKWIYVLQDGTIQTDPAKLPNTGVVGRYAYWADVENGRVNINTAGFGMANGPPNPTSTTNPTGRFQWNVENWAAIWSNPTTWTSNDTLANYAANVWTPNPWISDRITVSSSTVTFPALDRATAQKNTPQNLTAHPSSIDLSFLDSVTATQSFNTFRYAGSYFLRVDARNSYSYFASGGVPTDAAFSPPPSPDTSVRFFNDPSDWQLVVDPATYQRNKGYITVRGRTPEINPWGLPKIPLSLTSKDGHALNDLTEYYVRNVPLATSSIGIQGMEDSRLVQVPKLNTGGLSKAYPAQVVPPYPVIPSRSNFRDLANIYYPNSNYGYVAQLIYDLKNTLSIPCPGFSTSLGAKYNAYSGSGGEAEQIAVELITFVDGCLNQFLPDYAPVTIQTGANGSWPGISPYGLTAPMIVGGSTRREGTTGPFLVNEIAMTAGAIPYSVAYGGVTAGAKVYYALTPKASGSTATAMQVSSLPKAIVTNFQNSPALFLMLRQPKDNTPPATGSSDNFIAINLKTEVATPAHWGFAPPLGNKNYFLNSTSLNPAADLENTDIQWSTDDKTWNTAHFDVSGYTKVAGAYVSNPDSYPTFISDNPTVFSTGTPGTGRGIYEASKVFSATPYPNASTSPYTAVASTTSATILIGPFDPTAVPTVSLRIKSRIHFDFAISAGNPYVTWEMVPGIFPDFVDGWPGTSFITDASYLANSGKTDLSDPNDPSISQNWLEFDFTDVSTSVGPTQTVSYEATDPRVTRHVSDWKLSTNPNGTLGAVNTTYGSTPPDDSKLARPPSFWQWIRGSVRATALSGVTGSASMETQTASRILGLPGVGYLSEVPTGVDTGISPASPGTLKTGAWSTMKFNSTGSSDSPPDWLLWNLFYVPFDRSISNQTDGKLNINAKLYPFKDSSGNDLVREKPLEALLGNRVSNPTTLATAIAAGPTYTNSGALPSDLYVYAGQICQTAGLADSTTGSNEYDREYLTRDLADIVTTQASDYRVFIVAQTLKQSPTGQVSPVATQRVETTLSRVVDMGRQNYGFGQLDNGPKSTTVPYPFYVYLRSAYRPSSGSAPVPSATRTDVQTPAAAGTYTLGLSPLGADHVPNTSDDWLIPQKIEISSYKVVK